MIKTISATSYNTYQTCPKQWQYKYIYKLLEPDNPAFIIGKAYHKAVEMFHKGRNLDEINQELKKILILNKTKEEIDRYACVRKMFERYKEDPIKLISSEMEYQFSVSISELLGESINLYGFIDRISDNHVIDYKTTSNDYTDEDLINNIQTDIYSYVFWKEKGKMPMVIYHVMNKKKINDKNYKPQQFTIFRSEEDMKTLEDKLKEFYNNIINERFNYNEDDHCYWCPFKKYCKK